MGNRIIRGEILNSERYAQVDDAARLLFLHLCLLADDCGTLSLAPTYVRRQAFVRAADHAEVERLLLALADVDLIRIYEVKGSRYGFIPRFAQRCRITRLHHPMPPEALYADDDAAVHAFDHAKSGSKKNKDLTPNLSDNSQPSADTGQQNAPTRAMNPNPNPNQNPEANPTPSLPATAEVPRLQPSDCTGELAPSDKNPDRSEQAEAIVSIPLVGGLFHGVTQADIDSWGPAFPGVDLVPELHRARVWCEANPNQRKTPRGARKFLTGWLTRAQNAERKPGGAAATPRYDENGLTAEQRERYAAARARVERWRGRQGGVDADAIGAEIREVDHGRE